MNFEEFYIMSYFDGLNDGLFKTDEVGNLIFYPWGVLGKGYILPDEYIEKKIKRFKNFYHKLFLISNSLIAIAVICGYFFILTIAPLMFILYYLRIMRLLKDIPISDTKLNIIDSYANAAKSHNIFTLWIMFITSIIFTFIGIMLFVLNKISWYISLACLLFFGFCVSVIGYMLKIKIKVSQ